MVACIEWMQLSDELIILRVICLRRCWSAQKLIVHVFNLSTFKVAQKCAKVRKSDLNSATDDLKWLYRELDGLKSRQGILALKIIICYKNQLIEIFLGISAYSRAPFDLGIMCNKVKRNTKLGKIPRKFTVQ